MYEAHEMYALSTHIVLQMSLFKQKYDIVWTNQVVYSKQKNISIANKKNVWFYFPFGRSMLSRKSIWAVWLSKQNV